MYKRLLKRSGASRPVLGRVDANATGRLAAVPLLYQRAARKRFGFVKTNLLHLFEGDGRWRIRICLITVFSMVGCNGRPGVGTSSTITLVVSGDTAGWIVPCGCSSGQSGGLLRRASLVSDAAAGGSQVIVADVGGAAAGVSAYHRTKFESILRGELAMGLTAHNLGGSELAFGPHVLQEIRDALHVPFVSANTTDRDGQPLCPPAIVWSGGDANVLLIGVVDPSFATEDIQVTDPAEAVLRTLSQYPNKSWQGVVVLAWCPQQQLFDLAGRLPEVDAVIGGPTGQTIRPVSSAPRWSARRRTRASSWSGWKKQRAR